MYDEKEKISAAAALNRPFTADAEKVNAGLNKALSTLDKKIIVLDDDPTGIQTVHGVSVYTDWTYEMILEGFNEKNSLFFVQTNSRSFSAQKTEAVHAEIAKNIVKASRETGRDYIVISRGDSTLRGHYPLETETLKKTLEGEDGKKFDGEIIAPFFLEGGRYTLNNIHYVRYGDTLVPAGETEFANDSAFAFRSSHLGKWVTEKSCGMYDYRNFAYITLDELRSGDVEGIEKKLCEVKDFNKVILNAIAYEDLAVFCTAYANAVKKGRNFLWRSAASVVRVLGGIEPKPLLERDELVPDDSKNGGIIIVGSHVAKTSRQLAALKASGLPIEYIEFNQHRALEQGGLEDEARLAVLKAENSVKNGKTVAVYTRREKLELPDLDQQSQLKLSVEISGALTGVVEKLTVRPSFIVAKGGITSSDVGVRALHVKRATVLGQILPGIPVWRTGAECKFPGISYVIFPGNVGSDDDLLNAVRKLTGR